MKPASAAIVLGPARATPLHRLLPRLAVYSQRWLAVYSPVSPLQGAILHTSATSAMAIYSAAPLAVATASQK